MIPYMSELMSAQATERFDSQSMVSIASSRMLDDCKSLIADDMGFKVIGDDGKQFVKGASEASLFGDFGLTAS